MIITSEIEIIQTRLSQLRNFNNIRFDLNINWLNVVG